MEYTQVQECRITVHINGETVGLQQWELDDLANLGVLNELPDTMNNAYSARDISILTGWLAQNGISTVGFRIDDSTVRMRDELSTSATSS
jgi:hypothetical protein